MRLNYEINPCSNVDVNFDQNVDTSTSVTFAQHSRCNYRCDVEPNVEVIVDPYMIGNYLDIRLDLTSTISSTYHRHFVHVDVITDVMRHVEPSTVNLGSDGFQFVNISLGVYVLLFSEIFSCPKMWNNENLFLFFYQNWSSQLPDYLIMSPPVKLVVCGEWTPYSDWLKVRNLVLIWKLVH